VDNKTQPQMEEENLKPKKEKKSAEESVKKSKKKKKEHKKSKQERAEESPESEEVQVTSSEEDSAPVEDSFSCARTRHFVGKAVVQEAPETLTVLSTEGAEMQWPASIFKYTKTVPVISYCFRYVLEESSNNISAT